ncbi:TPA: hypothetical protein HA317_00015 [Candidatus Woesearchaeota archaeon]|nr:hypothetical protein [Candidatus Woesearchaeota archaeon]
MRDVLKIRHVYIFQNEDSKHYFHLWVFPRHKWMNRFGRKIESVRPIIEYAKENMANEGVFKQVRAWVGRVRGFMDQR